MSDQQDLERMAQAERLLDRALAHYSREPLAGFESRMVNRLRLEVETSMPWRRERVAQAAALVTLLAIAAAASLFIGLYLGQRRANAVWEKRLNELTANSLTKQNQPSTSLTPSQFRPSRASSFRRSKSRSAVLHSGRNTAEFPTPAPLNAQERALAAIAIHGDSALVTSLLHPLSINENLHEGSIGETPNIGVSNTEQ
jgi:hypothetical protein